LCRKQPEALPPDRFSNPSSGNGPRAWHLRSAKRASSFSPVPVRTRDHGAPGPIRAWSSGATHCGVANGLGSHRALPGPGDFGCGRSEYCRAPQCRNRFTCNILKGGPAHTRTPVKPRALSRAGTGTRSNRPMSLVRTEPVAGSIEKVEKPWFHRLATDPSYTPAQSSFCRKHFAEKGLVFHGSMLA